MTLDLSFHATARTSALVLVAALTACGPGKPGTTDTTDSPTSEATTSGPTTEPTPGSTTEATTEATPTSTGGAIEKCADARTEADCALATETDEDLGLGCRWGAVFVPWFPDGGDECSLEPKGGVCVLASFEEGGAGCFGFFRELDGGIELVSFECGTPADDSWQSCFQVPIDTPQGGACACINPDG